MKTLLMTLGAVVGLTLLGAWWGYVIHVLWAWFLVPLGVPSVGVAQAYGLSVLFGTFLGSRGLDIGKEKNSDAWVVSVITGIVLPAFALLAGWIALGFM